jgi:hypothetical protein
MHVKNVGEIEPRGKFYHHFCAAFMRTVIKSVKKMQMTWLNFYALKICMRKSCSLKHVSEIKPSGQFYSQLLRQ